MHLLERVALWKTLRVALGDDSVDAAFRDMDLEWDGGGGIYVDAAAESAARFAFYMQRARERITEANVPLKVLTALGEPGPGYQCQTCGAIADRFIDCTPVDETEHEPEMGRVVPDATCSACQEGNVIKVLAYPCTACGDGDATMHTAGTVPDACLGPMLRRASRQELMNKRGYDPEGAARNLARALAEERR